VSEEGKISEFATSTKHSSLMMFAQNSDLGPFRDDDDTRSDGFFTLDFFITHFTDMKRESVLIV